MHKRFRNTLLRKDGFTINGVFINVQTLKKHLTSDNPDHGKGPILSQQTAEALLRPNDRQDVPLMLRLLCAISELPPPSESDSPVVAASRRALVLLGKLYEHVLQPYTNVHLSSKEQLVHLAAASFILLELYSRDRTRFIPVQLYSDMQHHIRSAYFYAAKVKVYDPSGNFRLILMGTDQLEKMFGDIRTMVGNDMNCDQYQLSSRATCAARCAQILSKHPDWDLGPQRLKMQGLSSSSASHKHDHINPASWLGDTSVANVSLQTCWILGRKQAIDDLSDAGITHSFDEMERTGGFDILCPFGENKILLLHTSASEINEPDDAEPDDATATLVSDDLNPSIGNGVTPETATLVPFEDALDPDFDDHIGVEATMDSNMNPELESKSSQWVSVEGEQVHKATILRLFSDPLTITASLDRLKRVRNFLSL